MSDQALRDRIEELEEALRQAKAIAAPAALVPRAWQLTRHQSLLLAALIAAKGDYVSVDRLHIILTDGERDTDPIGVRVQMSNLRRKLADHGVRITSAYHLGWRLTPPSIATIAAAVLDEWREGLPAAIIVLRALLAEAEAAQLALDRADATEPRR